MVFKCSWFLIIFSVPVISQIESIHAEEVWEGRWGRWEAKGGVKQPFRCKQWLSMKADMAIFGQVFGIYG